MFGAEDSDPGGGGSEGVTVSLSSLSPTLRRGWGFISQHPPGFSGSVIYSFMFHHHTRAPGLLELGLVLFSHSGPQDAGGELHLSHVCQEEVQEEETVSRSRGSLSRC
ncbi:unnamed protein product [Lota lota]